jgi:hypothetical protein
VNKIPQRRNLIVKTSLTGKKILQGKLNKEEKVQGYNQMLFLRCKIGVLFWLHNKITSPLKN